MNKDQIESLIYAIGRIASGGKGGPDGLECVAMALAGDGLKCSVSEALRDISSSISELADAIRSINPPAS